MKRCVLLFLYAVVFTLLLTACGLLQNNNDGAVITENYSVLEDKDKLSELSSSVVMLECYDANGSLYASGSGFVAFQDNIVVTNYHVFEGELATIKVLTENGTSFQASSIAVYDKELDLAILELSDNSGLIPLEFDDSSQIFKGETVIAIGSPLGLMNSISAGIISGFLSDELNTIQFTASISHGSSGGALFAKSGKVIGVTYASFEDGQNLNLAIPSNSVAELWERRSESDKITIQEFYNTFPHIISVDDVINNRKQLNDTEVKIRGYISSIEILTLGTSEAKEVTLLLVNSQTDVTGSIIVIDDWSQATKDQNAISDYEWERWSNRQCISVIPDKMLLDTPLEPGMEIVIRGKEVHFDSYEKISVYLDAVSVDALEYFFN